MLKPLPEPMLNKLYDIKLVIIWLKNLRFKDCISKKNRLITIKRKFLISIIVVDYLPTQEAMTSADIVPVLSYFVRNTPCHWAYDISSTGDFFEADIVSNQIMFTRGFLSIKQRSEVYP